MDRLTEYRGGTPYLQRLSGHSNYMRDSYDIEAVRRLAAYEDTGLTPEECAAFAKFQADYDSAKEDINISRIIEILVADAEGRLIVLPCKAGEPVYWNTGIRIERTPVADFIIDSGMQLRLNLPTLGITPIYPYPGHLFLTREEAEAALEKEAHNGE